MQLNLTKFLLNDQYDTPEVHFGMNCEKKIKSDFYQSHTTFVH